MSYQPPLPNTGVILPVPASGQAWEVAVFNGNFTGVDSAIGADRARLAALETLVPTTQKQGLTLIKPSSVAAAAGAASIGANGMLTFTNATTVNVGGAFSALYQNYLLQVYLTAHSASLQLQLRLRAGVTDATSANYGSQAVKVAGGSVTGVQQSAATVLNIGDTGAIGREAIKLDIFRPFIGAPTDFDYTIENLNSAASMSMIKGGGTHDLSNSYDGFSLIPTTGNVSGFAWLFGYNIG